VAARRRSALVAAVAVAARAGAGGSPTFLDQEVVVEEGFFVFRLRGHRRTTVVATDFAHDPVAEAREGPRDADGALRFSERRLVELDAYEPGLEPDYFSGRTRSSARGRGCGTRGPAATFRTV
jgi:hypothetical protein